MKVSSLRKHEHVVLKGCPCKIVDIITKSGSDGAEMISLVGIDVFTGNKCEETIPATNNVEVPTVVRKDYPLNNIEDGFLILMNEDGSENSAVKVPDSEVGKFIEEGFEEGKELIVTVISAMGEEKAMHVREGFHKD